MQRIQRRYHAVGLWYILNDSKDSLEITMVGFRHSSKQHICNEEKLLDHNMSDDEDIPSHMVILKPPLGIIDS